MTGVLLIARRELFAYLRSPLGAGIMAGALLIDGLLFYWLALTEKLLTYATGARVQFADREDVAAIVQSIRAENYGLRTLIHRVVDSRPFLNK